MAKKLAILSDNEILTRDAFNGIFKSPFGLGSLVYLLSSAGKEPILRGRVEEVALRAFVTCDETAGTSETRVLLEYEVKLFPKKAAPYTMRVGPSDVWRLFHTKEQLLHFLQTQ